MCAYEGVYQSSPGRVLPGESSGELNGYGHGSGSGQLGLGGRCSLAVGLG